MYFLRKHIDEASIYQDRQSQVKAGGCKRPRPAPTPTRSGTPRPSAGPLASGVPLLYCTRISSILFIARCASMFFRRWMLSSSLCLLPPHVPCCADCPPRGTPCRKRDRTRPPDAMPHRRKAAGCVRAIPQTTEPPRVGGVGRPFATELGIIAAKLLGTGQQSKVILPAYPVFKTNHEQIMSFLRMLCGNDFSASGLGRRGKDRFRLCFSRAPARFRRETVKLFPLLE